MRRDSKLFAWSETTISVAGMVIFQCTGVAWDHNKEFEYVYGKGSKPLKTAGGNETCQGTLTVLQGGLSQLKDMAPGRKLFNLKNVDIQIAFVEEEGGEIERHSLIGVQFTGSPMDIQQNDKRMEIAIPFMALDSREG